MGENLNGNHVWTYKRLRIEPSGEYVKLIAPCGESRRVTPQTARKLAADLMAAADLIEERQAVMSRPGVKRGMEKLAGMENDTTTQGEC